MRGRTILVVDDEPHIRHMLDFKLTRAGYTVLMATSGQAAFETARARLPDLVVTDFQMPGGDGLELCTRLRAAPDTAEIPVLMLTARGYRVPPAEMARTNIRALIPKPFSPRELIAQIEELLRASAGNEERSADPEAPAA